MKLLTLAALIILSFSNFAKDCPELPSVVADVIEAELQDLAGQAGTDPAKAELTQCSVRSVDDSSDTVANLTYTLREHGSHSKDIAEIRVSFDSENLSRGTEVQANLFIEY